ncbi:MAG: XRE family transcriptional regulator [Alphaproteobacteria bacterium]|nr:XRE family transcriptional regulator [Alphaproteobacteria bacterium]
MSRNLTAIITALSHEEQVTIDVRHDALKHKVKGLRALRHLAGKAQADIASALNITQPSVSKIEKQTDMHLSTLRNYVGAVGGELELTVKLPRKPTLRIQHLGNFAPARAEQVRKKSGTPSQRRRHG